MLRNNVITLLGAQETNSETVVDLGGVRADIVGVMFDPERDTVVIMLDPDDLKERLTAMVEAAVAEHDRPASSAVSSA